jgi:hypothetical protein
MMNKLKIAAILAGSAALAAPAFGQTGPDPSGTINYFETTYGQTKTASSTIDPTPTATPAIITSILSQPGTTNGVTYTAWAFFANDGTGSADIYAKSTAVGSYTPTVGDDISGVSGTWYPYDQIPELETITAISANSHGNSVPSLATYTIPQLNVATLPLTIAGYLVNLDNVTISGAAAFGNANLTLSVTDSFDNSMTLYYWPSSYSVANANLDLMPITAGQSYDITGFDAVYGSGATAAPQFIPISITAVPEPVSAGLLALGSVALLTRRRRTA